MLNQGDKIGSYILTKKLGTGGFGEVWLAEKRSQFVTKKVAIKIPFDDKINFEDIKQEASLWEQASGHPNVLPIIDADIYDEQVVIISEYADGGSLADKIKQEGGLPVEKAVELTIGVLNGLDFLHSRNIIHRDIKPQNVLLQGNTPRLADFGISRVMSAPKISSVVVGTDSYMSPEAFDGKRNVQTDIWSVGVVLYEVLSGTLPFPQEHPTERMFAVLTKDFEPLPDEIPANLKKIVQKALSKKPEDRYQTAREMLSELQNSLLQLHQASDKTGVGDDPDNRLEKPKQTVEIKPEINTEVTPLPVPPTRSKSNQTDQPPAKSIITEVKQPETIPRTEVQFVPSSTSGNSQKNNSVYIYVGGIIGVLLLGAFISIGAVFVYFAIGSNKDPVISSNGDNPTSATQDSEFAIVKVTNGKWMFNGTETNPNTLSKQLSEKLASLETEKIIYISASKEETYENIVGILKIGSDLNIKNCGFFLSNEKVSDSVSVKLPASNNSDSLKFFFQMPPAPDPLHLTVSLEADGQIRLNDVQKSTDTLASDLKNIFTNRTNNGVFREGTNEIEKTVSIKVFSSTRYGKFIEIIRVVNEAGASPTNLQINDL